MIMGVRKTGESMEGKPDIKSSGEQNHGDSVDYFSCPLKREVANGAAIYLKLWRIHWDLIPMVRTHTLTLPKQAVTLCACHVRELNIKERYCVLDAEGKVIIALREMSAGTVNPKKNGNESCSEKNNESEIYGLPAIKSIKENIRRARLLEKMENGSVYHDE